MNLFEPEMERGAIISPCGRYRYRLTRTWDETLPTCCFVMLNPSTADAERDDATIRRCISFAKREGCGKLEVANLFAFRATDPEQLIGPDIIGPENDAAIEEAANFAEFTVLAWGGLHRRFLARAAAVLEMFQLADYEDLKCLGRTREGQPRHPLYVRADAKLEPYP